MTDPFDCGAMIGCDGDTWLLSNATMRTYVVNATCSDVDTTPFTALTALNCKCPIYSISPCTCRTTMGSNTTLTISCANKNLTDSSMVKIFTKIPASTPVDQLDLSGNLLTRVPANLTQYPTLNNLSLASNFITSIASGDLTLPANVVVLDVSKNLISSVSKDSLPANYVSGAQIKIDSNILKQLPSNVFQQIINYFIDRGFAPENTSISVGLSK